MALLLAGCDPKALLNRFVPKDDDAFARHFLDVVRAGDYAAADQMLDASLRNENPASGLHDLNGLLAHGEPLSVEVIGCNVFANASAKDTTRTTNLSYQIRFPGSWAAGFVVVAHPAGTATILGARFQPIPDSLEVLNGFTFKGKSVIHYLVFAACIAVPVLILAALVVCIRSRIRRKWLWVIFILLGFMQTRLNWTTGHFEVQPISFVLFGVSAVRPSLYAPWILGFGIPVGAIAFLVSRRKLLLDDVPQWNEPASAGGTGT
jgi:hypothetical protein